MPPARAKRITVIVRLLNGDRQLIVLDHDAVGACVAHGLFMQPCRMRFVNVDGVGLGDGEEDK